MDDPFAETRRLIAEWDAKHLNGASGLEGIIPLNWAVLRDADFNYEWLVEKWWPVESHLHIFAAPKTGKSLLMLWISANLALGRDPFTWEATKRQRVLYIDNEMTQRDVVERLRDMDIDFGELIGWLFYYQYPQIPPMDTKEGGETLLRLCRRDEVSVVSIDTLSRVVKGEENSNDTYRNFYNHTGRLLKANGIAMARLDHAGHAGNHSRGASAKADDVDLVYLLRKRADKDEQPGYRLERTHARIVAAEFIDLVLNDEPVSIKSSAVRTWSENAIKKARELDAVAVPIDASQRDAIRMLKEGGYSVGKTGFLMEALKLRLMREDERRFGL